MGKAKLSELCPDLHIHFLRNQAVFSKSALLMYMTVMSVCDCVYQISTEGAGSS